MRKLTIYLLNLFTLLNHAVVSWVIIGLPALLNHFPILQRLSQSHRLLFLGLLMTVKPLAEGGVALYCMFKSVSSIKRTLLNCVCCLVVSMCVFVLAMHTHRVSLLFCAMFLLGLGCSAIFVIQVALAQISTKKNRTFIFNMMEWSIGLGMSIGPFLLALCASHYSYTAAFALVVLLATVLWLLISRSVVVTQVSSHSTGFRSAGSRYYYLSWFFFMFGWQGYFHWFSSLMKHYFQFTEVQITMFYTALGVLYVFLQCAVVNLFVRYNIHRRVIFYTLPLIAVSFFMMGWAHSFIVLIVFSVVYMICISFYLPFWKSYISLKHITSHQMLFSRMTLITLLCTLLATFLGGIMSSWSLFLSFSLFSISVLLSVICFFLGEVRWLGAPSRSSSII